MSKITKPKNFIDLINKLDKECETKYGNEAYIGSGYGVKDLNSGDEPGWMVCIYSDDQSILDSYPDTIEDFIVAKRGIPFPL